MLHLRLRAELLLQPLDDLAPLEEREVAEDVLQLLHADVQAERVVLALEDRAERAAADRVVLHVAEVDVLPAAGGSGFSALPIGLFMPPGGGARLP